MGDAGSLEAMDRGPFDIGILSEQVISASKACLEPYARPIVVFVNEDYTSVLQGTLDVSKGAVIRTPGPALEID